MKIKRLIAIVLVALMALSLAACGESKTDTPATDAPQTGTQTPATAAPKPAETAAPKPAETAAPDDTTKDEVKKGGTMVIAAAIPTSLEWTQIRGIMEIAYMCPIYETLLRYAADGTPEPFLLESITPDSDALTWTMKIRDGITFSDGSPLDAEAVAWNLDYYKENGVLAGSYYANYDHAEVVDAKTVVCHFSAWDALFDYSLCRTTLIASKAAFDKGGKDALIANPVGTGPFILDSYETDVQMTMKRNDNYWQGEVYLDALKWVYYPQETIAATAVVTGEIDALATQAYNIVQTIQNAGTNLDAYTTNVPSYAYTICFNMRGDDPCADPQVRQAISYAIDSQTIADTLSFGYAKVSNQWAMPGSPVYNNDVEGQPFNVEKAKELLAAAGYADGFETTLTYPSGDFMNSVCQMIQEQLKAINIKVNLRPIEGAAYVNYIGGWEEGMLCHTMGMEAGAPSQYTTTFVNGLAFGLGMNAFVIDDELEATSRAIANSKTTDELIKNTHSVAKTVFDDQCLCKVVLITTYVNFVRENIHGGRFATVQSMRYDVWDAWKD